MVLGLAVAYLLGKSKGITVVVEPEKEIPTGTPLAQDWSNFDQDSRSLEELLSNARVRLEKE
jgi:hypothetical protein